MGSLPKVCLVGCNRHSLPSAPIRDSFSTVFLIFHFLPSAFSPTFPFFFLLIAEVDLLLRFFSHFIMNGKLFA
uniref:Uncharacterized protein n=1 Tax=Gossypium raimondii TaxID=29730 RepID=A0A0D2R850_GOSRA|nr:hypothetical protein B456_010G145200 [Gossypium raimondii]